MKKTTTKRVKKVKEPIAENYTASIKIFGVPYTSTGSTVRECIENLKVGGKVGGMCVLVITHGDKTKERILNARQLFTLFTGSKLMREITLKNVSNLFDL